VQDTFYWHDYETFGTDPSRDRAVQFAGVRTDRELNPIGEPLMLFSRPAADVLPHPEACLVTGITPQQALAEGVRESEFCAQIHAQLAQPHTCGVGYNSIRFDDEVTRYTLYRNFYDPYEREYQHGNSRWDIIDMVRLTYALRPEGISWPMREDGYASFRLEQLTEANGIGHEAAHDALSDVYATIAVARLVRGKQPRLYDYVLENRSKQAVMRHLDVAGMKPVLHVSGMFGAQRHNIALVVPLAVHPTNKNEIICYDLSCDPSPLQELDAETLAERLFIPRNELQEGVVAPGIKTIKANHCPVVATPRLLDDATAERLGVDVAQCLTHRDFIAGIVGLGEKLQALYQGRSFPPQTDPDRMLYSGGFFSSDDKRSMARVRNATPEQLRDESFVFEDARLPELLFRYRARNFPESLTAEEMLQWQEYRFQYLTDPAGGASICMDDYLARIESLQEENSGIPAREKILQSLLDYSDQLLV
jgi:exodeoxyribonuclease-1